VCSSDLDEQKTAKEIIASAESRLKILDSYNNLLHPKDGVDIEASVETYRKEREKVFRDHMDGTARERTLSKEAAALLLEQARLEKLRAKEERKVAKEKAKIRKAREKLREKQRRRDEEQRKEKLPSERSASNFGRALATASASPSMPVPTSPPAHPGVTLSLAPPTCRSPPKTPRTTRPA